MPRWARCSLRSEQIFERVGRRRPEFALQDVAITTKFRQGRPALAAGQMGAHCDLARLFIQRVLGDEIRGEIESGAAVDVRGSAASRARTRAALRARSMEPLRRLWARLRPARTLQRVADRQPVWLGRD